MMELMIVGFALMTPALIFFFSFKNRYRLIQLHKDVLDKPQAIIHRPINCYLYN